MREALRRYFRKRIRVSAHYVTLATRPSFSTGEWPVCLLFEEVHHAETGEHLAGHLWINDNDTLRDAQLKPGDKVEFDAFVVTYVRYSGKKAKSFRNRGGSDYQQPGRLDYTLRDPLNLMIVSYAHDEHTSA